MQRKKLLFSVFSVFAQAPQNKSIVNLYQKVLLDDFSEDIKMWASQCVELINQ